jgi:long-chain acyl-CoA synthetase
MNLGTLLPRHARCRADHVAIVVGDERRTYRQLNGSVNRLANALIGLGLRQGDKIAAVLPNCLELIELYLAAARTGLVMVPMSPLLQPSGLIALLRDCDSKAVVSTGALAGTIAPARAALPEIAATHWLMIADVPAGYADYHALVAQAGEEEPPAVAIAGDDPYNIIYSSGTTGEPKGIVHSHAVRYGYCTLFASAFRVTPESILLHPGSLVFNGAFLDLMPSLFVGATYVVHRAFDAEQVIAEIERSRVTHVVLVPSQIVAIMNSPAFAPERLMSLEMIHSVGAPLLRDYKERLIELLPNRFYELYGLTEGFVMTVLDRNDAARKSASVGPPVAFYEVRIIDEDGCELPPGEAGEICGRGPLVMSGYYKRPDLTAKTEINGWYRTGDVGYVDEDGFLYLVDRKKDMIISGGVNVYPRDIEEVAIQHPDIVEVAVFGVAHPQWGETPIAAIVLRQASAHCGADLLAWINARVGAKFQRLSDVMIVDAFPRNSAGKTLKRVLRERYQEHAGSCGADS